MAKKARTPAPPRRPVQAPQRRDTRRARARGAETRIGGANRLSAIVALALVAAVAVGAALYFGLRKSGGGTHSTTPHVINYNGLPGVRKVKAPWPPEYAHLDARLAPLGLSALSAEQLAYHIHQHVDIYLNGKHLAVPQCIGIFGCYNNFVYLTQLHTHAPDGVIHVEAATRHTYVLGDFFAEWGVFLSRKCVGGYCQGYRWYVNGKRQVGNPASLPLTSHLEIVFAIGKLPAKIPSTYPWNGL